MPQLTVDKVGYAKSGRPKIKSGNDTYYLGKTCAHVPPLGAVIDADTSDGSFTNSEGQRVEMWYLNSWTLAATQPAVAPRSASLTTTGQAQPNTAPSAAAAVLSDGERLTISNWVAQAISSGKVESPYQIRAWVNAALYAIRNAKADTAPHLDKPDPNEDQGFGDLEDDDGKIPF